MSDSLNFSQIPANFNLAGCPPHQSPEAFSGWGDPTVPLLNLSIIQARMDSLQSFLYHSVNTNTLLGNDQMEMVSTEISSAIRQIIVNGSALLTSTQPTPNPSQIINPISTTQASPVPTAETVLSDLNLDSNSSNFLREEEDKSDEWEIIELDSVELLEEHVHFCEYCGKVFKRDANLRMHMRAHGDQFKTREALAKPDKFVESRRKIRFSCPFVGCNRNKLHRKFRPSTSVIGLKNHFRRSHCPKMYSCQRCNRKRFSVLADLKTHLKHCGESKWKCSCGTSFSRKDKLFRHMALFEGHMPAVEKDEKGKGTEASAIMAEEEGDEDSAMAKQMEMGINCSENGLFEGLFEGFGSTENYCLQDLLDTSFNL